MRVTAALVVIALFVAGCTAPADDDPVTRSGTVTPPLEDYTVTCFVTDEEARPVADATCTFAFGGDPLDVPVGPDGRGLYRSEKNATGSVDARAPGRVTKFAEVTVTGPVLGRFVLELAQLPADAVNDTMPDTPFVPQPRPRVRMWVPPVTVTDIGTEPHLVVAPDGAIYYAPTGALFRSLDAGATWVDVSPTLNEALPSLGGDTSVSVAPDNSVWWSRYWGVAGGTIGCTSTDQGEAWTCDNAALPGATDRMWVVGLDATRGYLQTNEGLYHNTWAETSTGSTKYVPYATSLGLFTQQIGNMVFDPSTGAVWQITKSSGRLALYRVDAGPGLLGLRDTGLPSAEALPWLAARDGVLWTSTVVNTDDRFGVVVARSRDDGATWQSMPVSRAPLSTAFSYVATGPGDRAAVIYYGSDKAGDPENNGGRWSVYVAETWDASARNPTWIETRVAGPIHTGNVCTGLGCADGTDDPRARFSGDLIGIAFDAEGHVVIAYNEDAGSDTLNRFQRQVWS